MASLDDERIRPTPTLLTIFAVTLIAVLGVASIAPAFPRVARVFDATPGEIGALITAFTLPGVFLSPLLGAWADRWGRRVVLVPALLLFAGAGVACAFASDLHTLVLLRFAQGIGAAPLGSLNVTLIGDLYSGRRQVSVMGANAAVLSAGTAVYPVLGGFLAEIDWRWPFFLPLLALPVAWMAATRLPDPVPGEVTSIANYFQRIRTRIDRVRGMLMFASLLTFVVLYGAYLTYVPFVMDERFAVTADGIGLVFLVASMATMLVSSRLASITERVGRVHLLVASYVLYLVSMGIVPFAPSPAWIFLASAIFGAANGMNIPTLASWLASSVDRDVRAGVMALNAVALRGGQTLGPVIAGAGFAVAGIEGAFATGAFVSIALIVLSVVLGWAVSRVPGASP